MRAERNKESEKNVKLFNSLALASVGLLVITGLNTPQEIVEAKTKPPLSTTVLNSNTTENTKTVDVPIVPRVLTERQQMLSDAGIPESDWAIAEDLVQRESGWHVSAKNPKSAACGLAQEWPCGKSGCNITDGVCQLKWQYSYVVGRYGGYQQALTFWKARVPINGRDMGNWY